MLSEAKHLGGGENQRLFSRSAQILRWRSELALSVAEGMTGKTKQTPQNVVARGPLALVNFACGRSRPVVLYLPRGFALPATACREEK
jgi:hypothetical protein